MMYALCLHLHVLEEGGLLPSSFFHYKTVAHSILGTELPRLSVCISYKHPILINLLLRKKKKRAMLSLHIGLFTTIHLG